MWERTTSLQRFAFEPHTCSSISDFETTRPQFFMRYSNSSNCFLDSLMAFPFLVAIFVSRDRVTSPTRNSFDISDFLYVLRISALIRAKSSRNEKGFGK